MSDDPRPFDGYEYRVTRADGRDFAPCHAMRSFSGKGIIMVVPATEGDAGGVVGDLRDHQIAKVERIGVYKQTWVDAQKAQP